MVAAGFYHFTRQVHQAVGIGLVFQILEKQLTICWIWKAGNQLVFTFIHLKKGDLSIKENLQTFQNHAGIWRWTRVVFGFLTLIGVFIELTLKPARMNFSNKKMVFQPTLTIMFSV